MRDLLQEKGLDFEVKTLPITVYNPESGLYMESDKYKAITRTDNGHIYSTCTKRQRILQNERFVRLLVHYFGEDVIRRSKFILSDKNATKLSVLINNGNKYTQTEMELESSLTINTSFDQSSSLNLGITDQILICTNGLTRNEYKKFFSLRHTENMEKQMDDFSTMVKRFDEVYEKHYGFYERLKEEKVTKTTAYDFIDELVGVDFSKEDVEETTHTRSYNLGVALKSQIATSFREQGGNMFALLQGVTRYTTHDLAAGDITSQMYGNGYRVNNKAYEWLEGQLN